MKKILLNKGYECLVDDEDYEKFSQFTYHAMPHGNTFYARRAGYDKEFYRIFKKSKTPKFLLHREILGLTDPKISVDHIDGNALNNQKSNLRICTHKQNCANRKTNKNSKSGYKGLHWRVKTQRWEVYCGRKYCGSFHSKEEGAMAYNIAATETFGEFARLNKI